MPWIGEHRNLWRGAILMLVLVAIMGPWAFDLIWVPSEYTCSPPTVRLHGDYCGVPLSGIRILVWMGNAWVNASLRLSTGAMPAPEAAREFLFSLFLFLLALPVFNSLLLILRGDRRHWQLFSVVVWGIAGSVGLLVGLSNYPRLYWALWGVWLYIGLAASALVLEVVTLATGTWSS